MFARVARRAGPALVVVMLAAAAWSTPAHAYGLDGIPWPGRPATISYWNGTGYGDELRQAVAAWNSSGARVRFVPRSKRSAKLRVVYDERRNTGLEGLARGRASVGYQPRNRIVLGRDARGVGLVGVIAHELGHVLGLVHDDRRCAVMNAIPWSRCEDPPTCTILRRDDVRGAIARYGGSFRAQLQELCPPAPTALAVGRLPGSPRIVAQITVPFAESVVGVIERHAVGRCPERPDTVVEGRFGTAGSQVLVDVTPLGSLIPLAGGTLCVRAWAFDDTGRVSAAPATQQVALEPATQG